MYSRLYAAAWIVTGLVTLCSGIQLAGGEALGLPPAAIAWTGVISGVLGVINGFLPPLQRAPSRTDNAGPASNPDPMPRDT